MSLRLIDGGSGSFMSDGSSDLGSVSFANGVFYQVGNLLQVQFFHDAGPVVLYGADANK